MGYHGFHLLRLAIELDSIATLFPASGVGFFIFVWLLRVILLGVLLEYFTLFCIVAGAMHQACFCTGRLITWMACMICLALATADLLGVGQQVGFYSLMFPEMAGTVGISPNGCFRRCSLFVELFCNIHAFRNFACCLVGLPLKVPSQ